MLYRRCHLDSIFLFFFYRTPQIHFHQEKRKHHKSISINRKGSRIDQNPACCCCAFQSPKTKSFPVNGTHTSLCLLLLSTYRRKQQQQQRRTTSRPDTAVGAQQVSRSPVVSSTSRLWYYSRRHGVHRGVSRLTSTPLLFAYGDKVLPTKTRKHAALHMHINIPSRPSTTHVKHRQQTVTYQDRPARGRRPTPPHAYTNTENGTRDVINQREHERPPPYHVEVEVLLRPFLPSSESAPVGRLFRVPIQLVRQSP